MSAEPDYFSQFLPAKVSKSSFSSAEPISAKETQIEEPKPFSFDDYLPRNSSEESKVDSALRQSTQYASRALERVGGFIPDAKNFISNILIDSYEKAALGFGDEKEGNKQREAPEWLKDLFKGSPGELGGGEGAKTSPELKEISEKVSGGYTEPKTPSEEKIGSIVGDITSSLLGGNKSIKNNLLVPLGANLFESGLEQTGFDKSAQTYGKNASWFLMGLAANANANKFASELQTQARDNIIPNTPTNINKLGHELRPLNRKFIAGDVRSTSAKGHINNIVTDLRQGKNNVHDLLERIDAVNAEIDMKGGFDYSLKTPAKVRKAEIRNLNKVKGAIYSTIEESLMNQPGAFKKFMEAQQATGAIGASNKFMDFALKHWGKSASIGLGSLLGGLYFDPVYTGIASVGLLGLHKVGQIAIRMYKSPILKKYYINSVKAAAENNVPVFIQNMTALDRHLKKEEEKGKPPYKFQES